MSQLEHFPNHIRGKESMNLKFNSEGFFILDNHFKVRFWNPVIADITGISEREIIGKHLFEQLPEIKGRRVFFEEALKRGQPLSYRGYKPGTNEPHSISIFPECDSLYVAVRNITTEEKKEQELHTVRHLNKHVLNSTQDIIWAIDREYKLLFGNRTYFEIMKISTGMEKKVGENIFEHRLMDDFNNERKNMWKEAYDKALNNKPSVLNLKVQPDSLIKFYQVHLYPILSDEGGGVNQEIIGVSCFSRDVTERHEHLKSIEEQNRKLREIAWMQSHRLRSPLTNIMGLTDLAVNYKNDPEELKELLQLISESAKELDARMAEVLQRANEEDNE